MRDSHPIPDGFVLTCKAAILVSKTAKWVRLWNQRDIVDGDEMTGMQTAGFNQIVSDIYTFQYVAGEDASAQMTDGMLQSGYAWCIEERLPHTRYQVVRR